MSDLEAAYDNLGTLLAEDAAITALLGTANVLKGNREVEVIRAHELPALVLEVGRVDLDVLVHGHEEGGRHEMHATFVWENQDEATAFDERMRLVPLVVSALLGSPTLTDAVDGAWVSRVTPDMGFHHPRQSMQFTVAVDLSLAR